MKREGNENLKKDGRNWKQQPQRKKEVNGVKGWENVVKWGNNNAQLRR